MADKATVALIISETSPHLGAYFPALASSEDIKEIILSDEGHKHTALAKEKLGDKLTRVYDNPSPLFETGHGAGHAGSHQGSGGD